MAFQEEGSGGEGRGRRHVREVLVATFKDVPQTNHSLRVGPPRGLETKWHAMERVLEQSAK